NVPTFLEKPVGLNQAELDALRIAFAGRDDQVVVSFPLRMSPLFERARELVRRGRVGKMNQITAVNFVPYGGVYFGQWYRDAKATGGLWLQKATHDFDYICELAMAEPTGAMAMET
ncbi:MAG: Gfo/Idh/MocA family oxidoreductase, partial [Planctomycetota bacterium]